MKEAAKMLEFELAGDQIIELREKMPKEGDF